MLLRAYIDFEKTNNMLPDYKHANIYHFLLNCILKNINQFYFNNFCFMNSLFCYFVCKVNKIINFI